MEQKKLEKLIEIEEIEEPYKLLESWKWATLGAVAKINPSKSEIKGLSDETYVSFVPMNNVDDEMGEIVSSEIKKLGEVRKGYTYFREEDVIFAKITPCMENGKCAVAKNLINKLGFGSTEFHVIRPSNIISSKWIHLYLRQKSIRDKATKYFTGSVGQQRVPKEFLEKLLIPLPPIEEQKRIVARIEELFSRIKEIKGLRKDALKQIKALMPSALNEVFSKADEKGWGWVKLEDIFEIQQGVSMSPERRKGLSPYPFLRTLNVQWGYIDISTLDYMDFTENEISKLKLNVGDLLVCEGGEVGRTAIWKGEVGTCLYQNHIHRLRKCVDDVVPEFYMYWMQSAIKVFGLYKGQECKTAIPNLSITRLKQFKVPFPSIEEQKRVVTYLDVIYEKSQALQKLQEETEKEIEKLKETILHKAFRGEL
nr:restriction endonuclease subunit S [Candidatus Freyarchaeota archaeon]